MPKATKLGPRKVPRREGGLSMTRLMLAVAVLVSCGIGCKGSSTAPTPTSVEVTSLEYDRVIDVPASQIPEVTFGVPIPGDQLARTRIYFFFLVPIGDNRFTVPGNWAVTLPVNMLVDVFVDEGPGPPIAHDLYLNGTRVRPCVYSGGGEHAYVSGRPTGEIIAVLNPDPLCVVK
jgi:hypothetical protein